MPDAAPIDPAALPLRDIRLPEPVSWWPPAPGVWVVAALAALLLVLIVLWLAVRQRRQRIRREARHELAALRKRWCTAQDTAEATAGLSQLLRQVGLSYFGRAGFGGLTGTQEIERLNRLIDEPSRQLPSELGDWLRQAPYRRADAIDPREVEHWLSVIEGWVDALPAGGDKR